MATNATQENWFRGAVGRAMNPDGAFGLQCVDVADDYAQAIHGVPWGTCFGGGNANQHFPKNNGYWTSIGYNGNNRPERGDVIIWGGDSSNPYGHIAVVASSTMSNVSVIQQNYNTGGAANKPASLDVMPYSAAGMGRCVGWLRPNVPGATTPDPGEVVLGNAAGGGGSAAVVTRAKDQRWAVESCDVLESPRPGAKKVGSISKDDLVTMGGYVLGEWVSWNGRGSSFWFKPTSKGGVTRGGGGGTVLDGMDWDKLAMLESSGNWQCNTGNGFYGGLQFTYTTWLEFGGGKYADRADHATREQQIEIARAVLKGQGVMAWPNTGPKCYNPGAANSSGDDSGTVSGSSESLSGYVPFVYFDPQETYGVPDRTPYDTWTTNVPDPPKLAANAPEAHWDGNTWQGWQWNDSRTKVVWVSPNGVTYDGAYSSGSSSTSGQATMYPEPIPTKGPIHLGEISTAMWNYLLFIGWGGIPNDGEGEALWPPGTPGIVHAFRMPSGPVALGEVSDDVWNALKAYGWYGVATDHVEKLYPPERPMIVSPAFGSASAIGTEVTSGPRSSTIAAYSRTGSGTNWRYIAQRATTGEFLDMDLQIHRDELTWELSGPGCLRGTIAPDMGQLRAEDGQLVLQEWGTLIYAEADGEIRWGGILINSHWDGSNWEIECAGFSTYPGGQPYGSEFSATGADPGEVIRHIWEHLQSYQDGNLNVRVTNSITGAMVGLPKGPVTREQVPLSVWEYLQRLNWTYRDGDGTDRIYPPNYDGQIPPNANSDPLDPYELFWWEAPDCGTAIDNLVRDVPLDYVERHAWDGNKIKHEIQIAYPRCGRRRNDLAFIQGDNVVSVVAPETDGEYFANFVLGLGAGEGSGSIRRTTGQTDGRLRRASVYSGKDTTSAAQLDQAIANELRKRQNLLKIDSIEVVDHPNAPIGSWALGDDILVRADIPWLGEVELWCRVTGWSLTSNTRATLRLERSDAFSYAAESTDPNEGPITRNGDPVPYPAADQYPEDHGLFPNDPAVA